MTIYPDRTRTTTWGRAASTSWARTSWLGTTTWGRGPVAAG